MDTVAQFVGDVMTELERQMGSAQPFTLGGKAKEKNLKPPQITWVEMGGSFDSAHMGGTVGTLVATLQVGLWYPTTEACRAALRALYRAVRNVAYGANVKWGGYRVPTSTEPERLKRGELFVAQLHVQFPIPAEEVPTALVDQSVHETLVGGEVVCSS